MSRLRNAPLLERPLRPDLAAFFAISEATPPVRSNRTDCLIGGILRELARAGLMK
jgi:hypothetical protein